MKEVGEVPFKRSLYQSLIAQQLGYKPRMIEFEARATMIDYAMQEEHDPNRIYQIHMSKRKRYDLLEFYLANAVSEWNSGLALDPRSSAVHKYLAEVARRAMRACRGKFEGVHAQHMKAATEDRKA